MSYNQALYNRSTFNRSGSSNATFLSLDIFENINVFAGVGTNFFPFIVANERVRADVHGGRTIIFSASAQEVIGYNLDLLGTFWLDVTSNERILLTAKPSQVYILSRSGSENISKNLKGAVIPWFKTYGLEEIKASIDPRAEYWIEPISGYELVDTTASAESVEESSCIIEVTLHPGDRLIVDSDSYTVLLNGMNVIDTHHGNWFDELDRNTVSFTIRASEGTENLIGRLLYTERFL